jgi:hypothetical protein
MDQNLNVRPETLKLLKEIVGETFQYLDIHNDFLNRTQVALKLEQEITTGIALN